MTTVWKFPLETTDRQTVLMPAGATILTVAAQQGIPCLWALVDSSAAQTLRRIITHGTGHPAEDAVPPARFIGTYELGDGALVFHVFEEPEAVHE